MTHPVVFIALLGVTGWLSAIGCGSKEKKSTTGSEGSPTTTASTSTGGEGVGGAGGAGPTEGEAGAAGAGDTPGDGTCPAVDPLVTRASAPTLLYPPDVYEVFVFGVVDDLAYFVEGSELRRIPVAGGDAETVGPINPSWVRMIGNERVLWARRDPDSGALGLVHAPLDEPTDISVAVAETPSIGHVVVDEDYVFWATSNPHEVHRAPLSGEGPELLVSEAQPLGAVLHDGHYYWLDFASDHLERVPVTGGTREELTPIFVGGPMAAADGAIYWGDTSVNTIVKWSPDEGRITLANAIDPMQIQVVDDTVYWSQGLLGGRVKAIGVDGEGERDVLCNIRSRPSIVVTDDHVLVGGASGLIRVTR